VESGKVVSTFSTHKPEFSSERPPTAAFFAPNGQSVLYQPCYSDGAFLHNLIAKKDVCLFHYHAKPLGNSGEATSAGFSPDYKRVAVVAPSSVGGSLNYPDGQRSIYLFNVPAKAFNAR
jgi:hypothetical protein